MVLQVHDQQISWRVRRCRYYFPHMQPTDALILKTYDSAQDGRARCMGHTAFEDPLTAPDALMRESIEVRTMTFY